MLPVIYKWVFDTEFSRTILYLVAFGLVIYAASSGWRGATGPIDPKTSKFTDPNPEERKKRALYFGLIGVGLAGLGLYYALPEVPFFGRGKGEGIPIHTYGVLVGSGFICAVTAAGWLAQREWPGDEGLKKRDQIFDLAFYVFIGVMVGSRDLFVIVNWTTYMTDAKHAEAYAMIVDLLVLVGIIVGLAAGDRILKSAATRQKVSDEAFSYFITAFLGGRVVFSFLFPNPHGGFATLVEMVGGGLVFFGGLIGGALAAYWYAKRNEIEFLRLADIAMPVLSLGQTLGRLGCFSAGCCWGKITTEGNRFGVHFPGEQAKNLFGTPGGTPSLAWQSMHTDTRYVVEATGDITHQAVAGSVPISQWVTEHGHTLPIHPTQLYESLGQMILFVLLLTARNYRRFHGQIFAIWLMCYAVLRGSVELFRGDIERGTLNGLLNDIGLAGLAQSVPLEAWYNLSTSQFISICMFSLGATVLVTRARALRAQPTIDLNALATS